MFDELLQASKSALRGVDTYLTFPENQLGRAVVTRLHSPKRTALYGSITLVHGPAGVGKTHLAHWILKDLTQRHPRLKFAYASVNNLTQLIQQAEDRQSLAEMLEQFKKLDVLVCEDLDWLNTAPHEQERFMMLIDSLEESLTQILITSRRPVGQLRTLDQRLISRCHGGMCVTMTMPGFDSRVQLLQHWFHELKLPVLKPLSDSARFLAQRLPVSPRELREAVLQLAAQQVPRPTPIDVTYLEQWLVTDNRGPRLSFDAIVRKVAQEFGVDPNELRSRSRHQGLAVPRQCAMLLAKELTGRPLDQIGEYFDRSHTTVSHSLSRLRELLPSIPTLRQQVHKIRQQLKELPREDCA